MSCALLARLTSAADDDDVVVVAIPGCAAVLGRMRWGCILRSGRSLERVQAVLDRGKDATLMSKGSKDLLTGLRARHTRVGIEEILQGREASGRAGSGR